MVSKSNKKSEYEGFYVRLTRAEYRRLKKKLFDRDLSQAEWLREQIKQL